MRMLVGYQIIENSTSPSFRAFSSGICFTSTANAITRISLVALSIAHLMIRQQRVGQTTVTLIVLNTGRFYCITYTFSYCFRASIDIKSTKPSFKHFNPNEALIQFRNSPLVCSDRAIAVCKHNMNTAGFCMLTWTLH